MFPEGFFAASGYIFDQQNMARTLQTGKLIWLTWLIFPLIMESGTSSKLGGAVSRDSIP